MDSKNISANPALVANLSQNLLVIETDGNLKWSENLFQENRTTILDSNGVTVNLERMKKNGKLLGH